MSKYEFKLRDDMPRGFVDNDNYPELPAIFRFLLQYHNKRFKSTEEFKEVLEGFEDYLVKGKVPLSSDRALREGIYIAKLKSKKERFVVYCNSDSNMVGVCQFGLLEKIVNE